MTQKDVIKIIESGFLVEKTLTVEIVKNLQHDVSINIQITKADSELLMCCYDKDFDFSHNINEKLLSRLSLLIPTKSGKNLCLEGAFISEVIFPNSDSELVNNDIFSIVVCGYILNVDDFHIVSYVRHNDAGSKLIYAGVV